MSKTKFTIETTEKKIVGYEYSADKKNSTGTKKPAIIFSHGFMANQRMCKKYAKHYAKLGYETFTYDFCGGGIGIKSSWKMDKMSVFTEIADLKDVIEFVQSLEEIDSDNITLCGFSQGGFVSALVARDIPEQIKKIVLFFPALCIPDDARKGQMIFAKFDPQNIPERIKCGPVWVGHDFPALVLDMDPFKEISKYRGPVLLLHGTADRIVNVSYAHKAKEAYGDNCQLEIIEGGAHVFKGAHDTAAIAAMDEFLRK
ncbi:MAG: lysophospholipase [Treponema sp.]|nr:lysophospholipase [Treponema sp.]